MISPATLSQAPLSEGRRSLGLLSPFSNGDVVKMGLVEYSTLLPQPTRSSVRTRLLHDNSRSEVLRAIGASVASAFEFARRLDWTV